MLLMNDNDFDALVKKSETMSDESKARIVDLFVSYFTDSMYDKDSIARVTNDNKAIIYDKAIEWVVRRHKAFNRIFPEIQMLERFEQCLAVELNR